MFLAGKPAANLGKLILSDPTTRNLATKLTAAASSNDLVSFIDAHKNLPTAQAIADAARWRASSYVQDWHEPSEPAVVNFVGATHPVQLIFDDDVELQEKAELTEALERNGGPVASQVGQPSPG